VPASAGRLTRTLGLAIATSSPPIRTYLLLKFANLNADVWEIEDGVKRHRDHPKTFKIPPALIRYLVQPGWIVKMTFLTTVTDQAGTTEEQAERMWVKVQRRIGFCTYEGTLDNEPIYLRNLRPGSQVIFEPRHIIQIYWRRVRSAT
jgi:Uncharacterized protein conserved in bacteria (DUF2314)